MDEIVQQFLHAHTEVREASRLTDVSFSLLSEVVQRTGNFREGFFSCMKIQEQQRKLVERIHARGFPTPEAFIQNWLDVAQDFRNLSATIMTEADRIDR